jgi:hypothetical protein
MNCQRFEQLVSELARGQMMEAELRGEALAHSENCEHCLARLRDEEKLTRGLQMLAAEMETLAAPAEMELRDVASGVECRSDVVEFRHAAADDRGNVRAESGRDACWSGAA